VKFVGGGGIDERVRGVHELAKLLAVKLEGWGCVKVKDVVFNQVVVAGGDAEVRQQTVQQIQESGTCWCGGSNWHGEPVIRVSICSWATTEEDIKQTVEAFVKARAAAQQAG